MSALAPARLPGIEFDAGRPAPADTLPRMDVAAFVGFAASGPPDVPVAVEDAVRFRDVFGADLDLARAVAGGETAHSRLGGAVEAFFANGGQRCWVVRVADRDALATARFGVRGLLAAPQEPGAWRLGRLDARSGGSWAGELRVSALLRSRPLAARPDGLGDRRLALAAADGLVPGDVLRITAPDGAAAYAPVAAVTREPGGPVASWKAAVVATPVKPSGELACAYRIGPDGQTPVEASADAGELVVPAAEPIAPGELLRAGDMAVLVGARVPARAEDGRSQARFAIAGAWTLSSDFCAAEAALVERLTIDLLVWREDAIVARLADLGLAPAHPRYWRDLPFDDALFRTLANLPGKGAPRTATGVVAEPRLPAALWGEARLPRFPLAAPPADGPWLPLGLPTAPVPADAVGPESWSRADGAPAGDDRIERDGLAAFGAHLFVDAELAGAGLDRLDAEARQLAFLGASPRGLRGIHALYPVDEVSLVAVPDAAQRGWLRTSVERPPALGAPVLTAGGTHVSWTEVGGATGYRLEQTSEPSFAAPEPVATGGARSVALDAGACAGTRWLRVRALGGPWSNTVAVRGADFAGCARPPAAPVLRIVSDAEHDALVLGWTGPNAGYEVQVSTAEDFRFVEDTVRLTRTLLRIRLDRAVTQYARVRAAGGPWSNTAIAQAEPAGVWMLAPGADPAALLAVQRALLRFCAARDVGAFAVLSLPAEARELQAAAHIAALLPPLEPDAPRDSGSAGVLPLDAGEARALSFGALYHPWIATSDGGAVRVAPPDGPACGLIAARTLARGAWIAPANAPLAGALGLDPERAGVDPRVLLGLSIDPLVGDPRGVVPAAARTLSLDADLEPINVRRLLTLLRRVVLRDGAALVFEPHGPELRERVVGRLETLMAELYRRGAFAGAVASEAYRVLADESLNPPASVDAGRLMVELQVAPSLPMAFITVRLTLDEQGRAELVEGRP